MQYALYEGLGEKRAGIENFLQGNSVGDLGHG